jgi:signal transduction histidine kinase
MVWGVTLFGDLLFFAGQEIPGGGIRLLGTLIAAYVVLTHRLPDVRRTTRRILSYLLLTLLTVAIYTAGFTAVQYLFQDIPGYSPLWAGAAVALVLAVFFDPLLRLVQRLVNRLIAGIRYDPSNTVSEYSLRISNIVSLERLATVVVELIGDALEIQHGELFVVHYERGGQGEIFRLEGIRRLGAKGAPSGTLSGNSPVTRHLRETRQPLTQYDIDLLPEFRGLAKPERAWLTDLGMDVYVPIHAQGSWIGLLGLGPKVSGDRYYGDDLALLGTLSDQTAVALENARLVNDLIELNQDLEQAYATLAEANRQLQEMDRIKSAFIGVITHELRSPFANIAFSLQIFKRHGLETLSPEQREQLEQLTASLQEAKVMIDNLVTFATFLSKQGDLRLDQVDFRDVLQDTLMPLKSVADTKGLAIHTVVSDEMPPLQGDRERLADGVHHLVHNAIKFTAKGGEIWIRSQPTDAAILFEVKDSGVGIPADRLPDLWEGFTQMADPLRRGVEGLGLGLALVQYIVRAHGGRVWANSEEGVGSTFGFEIPLEGPQGPGQSFQASGSSVEGDAV